MKIKKGDEVVITAGKDRGAKGKVLAVNPTTNKIIVEGINRVTKHTALSTGKQGGKAGGIEHIEAAIDASNVMVVDGDGDATRVGYRFDEETGRNVRVSVRSGREKDL